MIKNFVDFYRQYKDEIVVDGDELTLHSNFNMKLLNHICSLSADGFSIKELLIDGEDVSLQEIRKLREKGSVDNYEGLTVKAIISIPTNGEYNIFQSVKKLVSSSKSILSGNMLEEYYLFEEDYYSYDESEKPTGIPSIINICKLISSLGELAHYHDSKLNNGRNSFVFINESETVAAPPVVLEPVITEELIELKPIDISFFDEMSDGQPVLNPHAGKEKALFRVSIIEFSEQYKNLKNSQLFTFLVIEWESFKKIFQRNLDTYISGFAFDKARKEVAEAEFGLAEQYSKVIGDISGKLFGLPVSFVAVFALFDKDTFWLVELIILIALFTASWLMAKLVENQRSQLERINHAKELSFDSLINNAINYPPDLKGKLEEANTGLGDSYTKLNKLLFALSYLVWLPFAITFYILAIKYAYNLGCYISDIIYIGL
ncbi:hypothetical protein [Shewanella algae]|uniref:hypothetical protein n=1 Tax=Shewanella algae TaxID=38313 RepID=UPI000F42C048|nr:hypothetical protein [Shewanella algae]AYV12345.1 hypothetical protein EEY24_05280 [Shewanella algae]